MRYLHAHFCTYMLFIFRIWFTDDDETQTYHKNPHFIHASCHLCAHSRDEVNQFTGIIATKTMAKNTPENKKKNWNEFFFFIIIHAGRDNTRWRKWENCVLSFVCVPRWWFLKNRKTFLRARWNPYFLLNANAGSIAPNIRNGIYIEVKWHCVYVMIIVIKLERMCALWHREKCKIVHVNNFDEIIFIIAR